MTANEHITADDEHHASDGTERSAEFPTDDTPPANEALPDGQFQDQQMPTTDGEPADPDPRPKPAAVHGDDGTLPTTVSSTPAPEDDEPAE